MVPPSNTMPTINTNSSSLVVGGSNEASEAAKLSKYKQMQQLVNQPPVYNKPKKKRKIVRRNYTLVGETVSENSRLGKQQDNTKKYYHKEDTSSTNFNTGY